MTEPLTPEKAHELATEIYMVNRMFGPPPRDNPQTWTNAVIAAIAGKLLTVASEQRAAGQAEVLEDAAKACRSLAWNGYDIHQWINTKLQRLADDAGREAAAP